MQRTKTWMAALWVVLAASGLSYGQATTDSKAALKPGDFVAVCGDPITEQKAYSVYIENYLLMCQPTTELRTLQAGWGGEVADGFAKRMAADVLILKPTVATTCYGMNDGGYGPLNSTKIAWYRAAQKKIIQSFKTAGVRMIIIGSPGVVDSDTYRKNSAEVYNKSLGQLGDICKELAAEEGVIFADVHTPMMDVMAKSKEKYGKTYHLGGGDGVHPGANGHLVMAYAFLKAMGCDGNIGTITMNLGGNKATASAGHTVLSAADGTVEIESSRYPFCFYGDPTSPTSNRGPLEFLPFNQELNRLQLVVQGASANAKYKVTWGETSKEFDGVQLAKGINLAAEFLDNPFSKPFSEVDKVIRQQQGYETNLTKSILHNLQFYRDLAPEESATLDRVAAKAIDKDTVLAKASTAAVKPVKHSLKVELLK